MKKGQPASLKARKQSTSQEQPPVVYIHGIGKQEPADELKREWDLALFGREMGPTTRMAYWSDILHPAAPGPTVRAAAAGAAPSVDSLLTHAGVDPRNKSARQLAESLLDTMGVDTGVAGTAKVAVMGAGN